MAQFISTDDANPVQCFRLCGRRGQSDSDCGIAGGTIVDAGYGPRVAEKTHWHFDHTDGNAAFAAAGATILAHANSRARLLTSQ
jgi:hypothetical protein